MCARESEPGNAGICSLPPLCLAVVLLRRRPKGRASASARAPEVQRGMRGRQARRARVRHAAEASMTLPAASPTCRRCRGADGLLWTEPRTAPILRWLLCRGGGRGQCGRKRERRRRAAETSQPIRGELHRPTSGRAGDDSAAHPDRPHSASSLEPTNLDSIATPNSKNLATPNFPGTRRIVDVTASPSAAQGSRSVRLQKSGRRAIATLVGLGLSWY